MPVLFMPAAIDAVVKASLILAVAALAAASLRRASASARHLVWMLGLVSALAVPAVAIVTPRWELPIVKITAAAPTPVVATTMDRIHLKPSLELPPRGRSDMTSPSNAAVESPRQVAPRFSPEIGSLSVGILFLWAVGA